MANARFRPRGDTAANWTSVNPVLALRELGLELDTGQMKVGDGVTAWNSLAYFGSGGGGGGSYSGPEVFLADYFTLGRTPFVTDDLPAFEAALADIEAASVGPFRGSTRLILPADRMFINGTLNVHVPVHIVGVGSTQSGEAGSLIRVAKNTNGIVFNYTDTHGDGLGAQGNSNGSILEGVQIWGGNVNVDGSGAITDFSAGDSPDGHGIRIRGPFVALKDVMCAFFGGSGFNVNVTAGGSNYITGNGNSFYMERCYAIYNGGHAYEFAGNDANAGITIGCSAIDCAGSGFHDYSFLGNTHIQAHVRDCGIADPTGNNKPVGACLYGGTTYAVGYGQETAASTTTPGTNSTVWVPFPNYGNAGAKPWVTGDTWAFSRPYATNLGNDGNARGAFLNCYAEAAQAPIVVAKGWKFDGGVWEEVGADPLCEGLPISNADALITPVFETMNLSGGLDIATLGEVNSPHVWTGFDMGAGAGRVRIKRRTFGANDYVQCDINNSDGTAVFLIDSLSGLIPGAMRIGKLHVGSIDSGVYGAWRVGYASSSANVTSLTSRAHGDVFFSQGPTTGSVLGWRVLSGGTVEAIPFPGAPAYTDITGVPTDTFLGRDTAGTGAAEAMSVATAKALLAIAAADVSGLAATATSTDAANLTGTLAAARIADNSLPPAKLTNASASTLLGRRSGSGGAWEAVTLGANLSMDASGVLSATGGGGGGTTTNPVTFDTTGGAAAGSTFNGSAAVTVDFSTVGAAKTGAITGSNLTMATARMLGRTTASTGAVEELTAAAAKTFLSIASGDVSGLGAFATSTDAANLTGTVAAARIADGSLGLAKIANIANSTILGNNSGGAGPPLALTAAQTKTLLAIAAADVSGLAATATSTDAANLTGTLAVARLPALTGGDVTSSAGSGSLAIGNNTVTDAKLRTSGALSVIGRSANSTGNVADIAAANDGEVLRRSGTSLGFGTIATAGIADAAVTLAKMANMATASLIYRKTASSGPPEVNTLATLKADLGLTGTNSGDQTITLTGPVTGSGTGSFATTIADGAVTLAKMANLAANSIIGNNTGSAAVPLALTAAQVRTLIGVSTTGSDTTYAFRANNLSDLASAATARTNLGLGTAATKNIHVGTSAPGSPAAGDLWVDTN